MLHACGRPVGVGRVAPRHGAVLCRCSRARSVGQFGRMQVAAVGLNRSQATWAVRAAAPGGDGAGIDEYEEPSTSKEAIELGLKIFQKGDYAKALATFEQALDLPGTGTKRWRDKPRLPSDGERMAVLYNTACCYAQLQDARNGLLALASCLELGYADFAQIRSDPDLAFLREDERFEGLMQRFQPKRTGLFGSLFG